MRSSAIETRNTIEPHKLNRFTLSVSFDAADGTWDTDDWWYEFDNSARGRFGALVELAALFGRLARYVIEASVP